MKKHFEQAIAFDRDNPLNQRTGLGKKYNELVDEYNALEEKYNELGEVSNIYKDYMSKLADTHKSSEPLEVHVVCGRGKKSMTAGADDQLEEQDDGNNQ